MPKPIVPPINTLFLDKNKGTKFTDYLNNNPLHCFSDTGIRNLAGRFRLSVEEVKQLIKEFGAREGQRNG